MRGNIVLRELICLLLLCKTRFGDSEYHTSDDNLNIVSEKGLEESFNVIKDIVDALEIGVKPVSEIYCEPNLGKKKLISKDFNGRKA